MIVVPRKGKGKDRGEHQAVSMRRKVRAPVAASASRGIAIRAADSGHPPPPGDEADELPCLLCR